MEKKISDLDYSEIAAAINGYLNSEASIKQYVLSDLGSVPFIENVVEKGALHNIFSIGLIDTASQSECRGRKVYDVMTGYHMGIQLGGNCAETSFFNFTNLSFTEANKIYKPGIGMIPQDNDDQNVSQIIIPLYRRQIKHD